MTAETEREAAVKWLRNEVAAEAIRMMLVAGMPGGTRTERVKAAAFAEGCAHAVTMIREALERGAHIAKEGE
jgi:hypothetical protein